MFDITSKEQLLKNIRKGLVQPLPNQYPLLNFDKQMVKTPLLRSDESFIKSWVEKGYYFAIYNGFYDLMQQLLNLSSNYNLGILAMDDKNLCALFTENELSFVRPDLIQKTICSGFSKLEVSTNTLYFSTELHPLKHFQKAENLILFGKANQIDSPENNKYFSELMIKSDIKVQLPIHYFKRFKSVFLFIEE